MCSSKQVCNGELPLLHHNCGNYRKPSLTNAICGQNLAWGPPFFIAFLKTTQNFLQVGYLIYPKSMREEYGLNLYLSLRYIALKCPKRSLNFNLSILSQNKENHFHKGYNNHTSVLELSTCLSRGFLLQLVEAKWTHFAVVHSIIKFQNILKSFSTATMQHLGNTYMKY